MKVILMVLHRHPTRLRYMLARREANKAPILTHTQLTRIATMILPRRLKVHLNRPRQQKYNHKDRVCNSTNLTRVISSSIRPTRVMRILTRFSFHPKRSTRKCRIRSHLSRRTRILIPSLLKPLIKVMITTMPSANPPTLRQPEPAVFSALIRYRYSFHSSLGLRVGCLAKYPLRRAHHAIRIS